MLVYVDKSFKHINLYFLSILYSTIDLLNTTPFYIYIYIYIGFYSNFSLLENKSGDCI
jgi:hypothetical protein